MQIDQMYRPYSGLTKPANTIFARQHLLKTLLVCRVSLIIKNVINQES